jgi:copper chaperone
MSTVSTIVEDLEIEGMSCRHCIDAVEGALAALQGVVVEEVAISRARIAYPAGGLRPEAIDDAVEEAGYRIRGRRQVS